jgi:hypothetical protein
MKTTIRKTPANLLIYLMMKLTLACAICGLGLLSTTAFGQALTTFLNIDCTSSGDGDTTPAGFIALVANGTGGANYVYSNVGGTGYTLTLTNIGCYGGNYFGKTNLSSDGWLSPANKKAGLVLSGLPVFPSPAAPTTVAVYSVYAWDGAGSAGKITCPSVGGTPILVTAGGVLLNPSTNNMTYVGTATVAADGTISLTWTGNTTGEGQLGGFIFAISTPCHPVITVNGANPMILTINGLFADSVTAVDSCSGSPVTVTTTGTVNTTITGTNILTYKAIADGITNTATRTVIVVNGENVNLDLAKSADGVNTPAGFNRLNYSAANITYPVVSDAGGNYTVGFTNIGNTYKGGGDTNAIDTDGFRNDVVANVGTTVGFYVAGLVPGSQITLYACWAWDGAPHAAVITYGGATNTLNVGTDITAPSAATFDNVGTAYADASGTVRGTWTGITPLVQGQIGGMIFNIVTPMSHNITLVPAGITNNCLGSASITAVAAGATSFQWYNNLTNPISGATSATLVLNNMHPSGSGNYTIIASGPGFISTNQAVILTTDVTPPLMTMNGNGQMLLALNAAWTDPGATAYDTCPGNSLTVTTNGSVNTAVAGEYIITYSATTGNGNPGQLTRSVVVVDPSVVVADVNLDLDYAPQTDEFGVTPPAGFTLLLYGDLVGNIYGGTSFPNPDGNNPNLTLTFTNIRSWSLATLDDNSISINGFSSYSPTPAQFTLSGVPAGQAVAVYAVYGWNGLPDAPLFNYGGQSTLVTAGSTTNSSGTPADFQYIGTAIASNGVVTGTWTGPGGATHEGDVGGMIFSIQSIPIHSLVVSPASITPQCGSNVTFTATASGGTPFTYQWYDIHTNLIVGATNATYTLVDPTPVSAGNYTVVVRNSFGSATNIATVLGVVDVALPMMALNGANPVNIVVNGTYVDAGATAYDICAQGSLTVSSNNPVDTTTIGTYTVTYTAVTANNNTGTVSRTVNVTAIPNLALNLDLAPSGNNIPPAPDGFTLVQGGGSLSAVANYNYPNVAGSIYSLSISNVSMYNTGDTNKPLTTTGFYKSSANNDPATFTLSGLQPTLKVTLYAIYAWNGAREAGNVFFGGTNTQIANTVDPGTNTPSLTNFTRIGATLVDSSGTVSGYWQGPITTSGTNTEGEVGGLVFLVGTNTPPVASPIAMSAIGGHPSTLNIIGGASAPTDADGDPLTITAVQSPTPNSGTVTTDGTNVTYTSSGSFIGTDTFNYTVGDGYGGFSTAIVTVTVVLNNQPPVAYSRVMGAASGLPSTLKIIGGASPPTDPDGDTMTVTAVQSPTPHSGTVTTDGTNVTYTSSNGFTGTDTFTYTVGDGRGGFATATVTVSVVGSGPGFNILSSPTLNGGVYQVGYQGIPYAQYVLLKTPSLNAPITWTPVVTNTAGISGVITFTFTPSQSMGFYRTSSLH